MTSAAGEPGSKVQAPMVLVLLRARHVNALNMLMVPAVMLRFGSVRPGAGDELGHGG